MNTSYNTHFYLYAKGHYVRSLNVFDDLRVILSDYTGINFDNLSNADILNKLLSICEPFIINKKGFIGFVEFVSRLDPNSVWSQKNFHKDLVSVCLNVLSIQSVESIERYDGKIGKKSRIIQKRIMKKGSMRWHNGK
jgi:hypothetical protein